jgi:hypothetical protein
MNVSIYGNGNKAYSIVYVACVQNLLGSWTECLEMGFRFPIGMDDGESLHVERHNKIKISFDPV